MNQTKLNHPEMRPPKLDSITDFQKMIFIYNAVNDGWTTSILSDGRYEFKKQDQRVTSDECLDEYLKRFIEYYMTLQK
jgi:hypothetical protein